MSSYMKQFQAKISIRVISICCQITHLKKKNNNNKKPQQKSSQKLDALTRVAQYRKLAQR